MEEDSTGYSPTPDRVQSAAPHAAEVQKVKETLAKARAEVGKVIIGQHEVIDQCLIAIFTGNHILLEGVPGVAKTLLVRTLAKVLGTEFSRIQFTPDLMPSDITGTNIFNMGDSSFHLVKGPVFTSFLLADEINRAPAKTQSALLQAMQERLVTIDGETHKLPDNFTVFATQNPIEYEGTYPLPEAQKDRFLLRVEVDYPSEENEKVLARKLLGDNSPEKSLAAGVVQPVLNGGEIAEMQKALQALTVKEELIDYVVELIRKSRSMDAIEVGAGPRATSALLLSSRAHAAIQGRDFVTPDDIRTMAYPVLSHRLVLRPEYEIEGITVREAIARLMESVAVPR
ncbi:MAG: MoxR family ATPase [Verrucomicrobiales bacterium]|nr:MoxR family ATPase [Verrucomicrobiales bacterium]